MTERVNILPVRKSLGRMPIHLLKKFRRWVADVEELGLHRVQALPGWRDHQLKGRRRGERAIRLDRKWRAVYVIREGDPVTVTVIEIHAHAY